MNTSRRPAFQRQRSRLALLQAIRTLDLHNHIALIYESQAEQFDAALPFMRFGLARAEKCIYITDDNAAEEVIKAAPEYGIDVEEAVDSGALTVTDPAGTYLQGGSFEPNAVIDFLSNEVATAKAEGYTGLRATGEMTWELGDGATDADLLEYESRLNRFLETAEALAICQYNRHRFAPSLLQEVIRTHPTLVYGYTVAENYYYVPTEDYLNPDPERDFERMLTEVIERDRLHTQLVDRHDQLDLISNVIRHNFRNKLNVIAGTAQSLNKGDAATVAATRTILHESNELRDLTDEVQRIEHTLTRDSQPGPIRLTSVLEDVVATARTRYPDARIHLDVDRPVEVIALPSIATAFEELIDNAVEHNDRGFPRIDVGVTVAGGAVDVVVSDDGPGIPALEVSLLTKEHDIEPLYHNDGLGLWLIHWIVSRSQGELRFGEREPTGSEVTVRLGTAGYVASSPTSG